MEDDDDISFCQVGSSGTQDGSVKANLSSDAGGITIIDEGSNGISGSSGISSFVWEGRLPKNAASRKEGTVGSLSFSVISTSSPKQSVESPRQVTSRNPRFSAKNLEEQQKLSVKKPAPRSKVPFEKGYSQMDWLKLTRTHPDLSGLKGESTKRLISMDEVEQNQMEGSMWTVLKGRLYNLSPYMKFHPGE